MKKPLELIEELTEDLVDLFFIFVRRNEPTITFEEAIADLKRDGKLLE